MTRRILLALALSCTAGCEQHLRVSYLAPLEDAVLAIDEQNSVARIVRVDASAIESTDVALSEGTARLLERPGSPGEVLVLTRGLIGDADEDPVPAEVVAIDRTGEVGRWSLGGQYDEARVSSDGRYVLALAPRGRLVVENRVEVIDTALATGEGNPIALSLRSLGGETPTTAAFSSSLPWTDGASLRLAALFAAGQLSLFDLDHPEVAPITIPTTTDVTTVGPAPVEGVFIGSELLIRAEASRQLLVVTIGAGDGAQRFDVSVRSLAASGPIDRMLVDERSEATRVIALSGSTLHLFDLETGIEASLSVPPGYGEILPFEGPAPGDPTVRPRLVLWGWNASLTFVELGDEPTEILDSSTMPLADYPRSIVADPAAGRLILFTDQGVGGHPLDVAGSSGKRPVSVIDLFDRSALALGTSGEITAAVVTVGRGWMWIAGREGYVARFDLDSQARYETWLSSSVETLLPLHGESQRVLAFHSVRYGTFSVLEASGEEAPRLASGRF